MSEQVGIEESLKVINAAHADAKKHGFGIDHFGEGSFPCPKCKTGTVNYRVAALNGHIHGACSTEDCVSWME